MSALSIGVPALPAAGLALGLLLGLVLGWRRQRDLLALGLGALAATAFWALLVDLAVGGRTAASVLVTPGAGPVAGERRWTPDGADGIRSLLELPPDSGALEVRGYGLPADVWDEARLRPYRFVPPAPPPGLHALRWPSRVIVGETIRVSGRSAPGATVTLASGAAELAATEADGDGRFRLDLPALVPGALTLRLSSRAGSGQEDAQELGVDVAEPAPLTVQGTFSAPSADVRALRDWLLAAGAARGEFRLDLAPGITREERLGTGEGAVAEAQPDLVFVDAREPGAARRVDEALALAAGGAGLLILHRGGMLPPAAGFDVAPLVGAGDVVVPLADARLPARRTGRITVRDGQEVVVADEEGRALVVRRRHGDGRVALSVVEGSGGWPSSGRSDAHGAFWAEVVGDLARPRSAPLTVRHGELVATVGLRSDLCAVEAPPEPDPAPALPLLTVVAAADWHCRAWWPDRPGWHRIGDRRVLVHPVDSFWPDRARSRMAATTARLVTPRADDDPGEPRPRRDLWWVLLALGAAGLWWRSRTLA